jgi:hypothetical protein
MPQTVGFCEGVDKGTVISTVFYDTTGEYALPLSQLTTEWRQAMAKLLPEEAVDWRASALFEISTEPYSSAPFQGLTAASASCRVSSAQCWPARLRI